MIHLYLYFTYGIKWALTVLNQLQHLLPNMVLERTDMFGNINERTCHFSGILLWDLSSEYKHHTHINNIQAAQPAIN